MHSAGAVDTDYTVGVLKDDSSCDVEGGDLFADRIINIEIFFERDYLFCVGGNEYLGVIIWLNKT